MLCIIAYIMVTLNVGVVGGGKVKGARGVVVWNTLVDGENDPGWSPVKMIGGGWTRELWYSVLSYNIN